LLIITSSRYETSAKPGAADILSAGTNENAMFSSADKMSAALLQRSPIQVKICPHFYFH